MHLIAACAALALASPPSRVAVQGRLGAASGVGVDGEYAITVSLYAAASGGAALWSTPFADVPVADGIFSLVLDAVPPDLFDDANGVWLGLKVEGDPELPRTELVSTPMALVAAKALDVACSGCVGKSDLAADLVATIEAGGGASALIAAHAADPDAHHVRYSDAEAVAAVLAADVFLPKGTAILASMLPADGLDEVSGGLISTTFQDVFAATGLPLAIKDQNPTGISSTITVPNVGIAKSVEVRVNVAGHSNVSELTVTLFPPDQSPIVLFKKGSPGQSTLDLVFPAPDKPVSGDLGAWVEKNIQGAWHLLIVDDAFDTNTTDGQLTSWEIRITTLSNKKLQVTGDLHTNGKTVTGLAAPVTPTDAANKAYVDASFKDRVFSKELSALQPGQSTSVTHGAGTNLVFAQAWFKDPASGFWSRSAGAISSDSVGDGSNGAFKPTSSQSLVSKTYNYTEVVIPSGVVVTVTGANPLVMRAQSKITIAGTLTLAGGDGTTITGSNQNSTGGQGGGGGGSEGGACVYGGNATAGVGSGGGGAGGTAGYGGGGGGGGHAQSGQAGFGGNPCGSSLGTNAAGGGTYPSLDSDLLAGGSGGGGGGYGSAANAAGGGGGGGGGALKLVAPLIELTGTVTAAGGAGGALTNDRDGGGGGGGSGGSIWIVAETVKISGTLTAVGGAGGVVDKGGSGCYGGDGGKGADGRIRVDASFVSGTSTPVWFKGGSAQGFDLTPLRVFQPDTSSVSVQNLGLVPLDVKLLVIVP